MSSAKSDFMVRLFFYVMIIARFESTVFSHVEKFTRLLSSGGFLLDLLFLQIMCTALSVHVNSV